MSDDEAIKTKLPDFQIKQTSAIFSPLFDQTSHMPVNTENPCCPIKITNKVRPGYQEFSHPLKFLYTTFPTLSNHRKSDSILVLLRFLQNEAIKLSIELSLPANVVHMLEQVTGFLTGHPKLSARGRKCGLLEFPMGEYCICQV